MKNYLVPIIAVILIVGILCFFAFSASRNKWFGINFLGTGDGDTAKEENLPSPSKTPSEKEDSKTSSEPTPDTAPSLSNDAQKEAVKNVDNNGSLVNTGAANQEIENPVVYQTSGIMTQKTTITINGETQTFSQEMPFTDYQSLYQYQKATIEY